MEQSKRLQSRENATNNNEVIATALAHAIESRRSQVFRFLLLSIRDAEVAARLTGVCLSIAYRDWHAFARYKSTTNWLVAIANRRQKHHWRKQRIAFWRSHSRDATYTPDLEDWAPFHGGRPEVLAFVREQVRRVWKAVNEMDDNERTIFLLRFVEELDWSAIIEITGSQERDIKQYLSMALGRVRSELNLMRLMVAD
jgi:RNA polymerase sigma-70 factor (ECF subfamily)